MKKFITFLVLVLISAMFFNACEDETFTEEDAINAIHDYETLQDSLANAQDNEDVLRDDSLYNENVLLADSLATDWVVLTIKVIDASSDFSAKSGLKGQSGATVTINTQGEVITGTTGADGAAHFPGLEPGSYAVNVSLTGYTTVDFVTYTNYEAYYSVQVPILQTTANLMTITGTATCETDLLNTSREAAATVTVFAQPNLPDFFGSIPGVVEISYSGYTNTATTDASGAYTINVPADYAGELDYDIFVPTFEASQTLMLNEFNGVDVTGAGNSAQAIPTRFGTDLSGSETAVPSVNPVYCVFGAPTHTLTAATLVPEIYDAQAFHSVYVTNSGNGYASGVKFTKDAPGDGVDAVFTINTDNSGQNTIEYITVTSGGSGFDNTTLDLSFQQQAANFEVTSIGGTGDITGIGAIAIGGTDGNGRFLTNDAGNFTLSVSTGSGGSGASVAISGFTPTDRGYSINGFSISNGGSGYVVGDNIGVSLITANLTTGAASGTLSGAALTVVQVTNPGSGYPKSSTQTVKFGSGNATADATIDAYGKVAQVTVTSGGSNYSSVPTATVDYDLINKNATADVFVQDGEIKSLFNTVGGAGYDNLPAVTFYNQYTAGNPAITVDYDITINGGDPYNVTGVTINDGNSGISENLTTKTGDPAQSNVESVPGGTIYVDFYLGTGVRTAGN